MARRNDESGRHPRKHDNFQAKMTHNPTSVVIPNKFVNDGSFLEMFKKKMAEGKSGEMNTSSSSSSTSGCHSVKKQSSCPVTDVSSSSSNYENIDIDRGVKRTHDQSEANTSPGVSTHFPIVGKRRIQKILKTGMVAKKKEEEKVEDPNKDAWSKYLDEVRKYKSQKCIEDDASGTPLVK